MSGLSEEAVRAALSGIAQPPAPAAGGAVAALTPEAVAAALQQAVERPLGECLALRESILSDPSKMGQISIENPPMADALRNPDPMAFVELIRRGDTTRRERDAERQQWLQRLEQNPFDVEAQAKMEEMVRQQNVEQNYEAAMEHNPEVFGSVTMLYVESVVNGVPMKAFVDCGAQMTVMSVATAERVGIMRLVDRRFAGMARGVGSAPIVGRVHSAPIKTGNSVFPCSFTVMEQQGHDFLLGLDMLKRYQACIDLRKNTMRIGEEEVPFLSESAVPESERVGHGAEEDVEKRVMDGVTESSRQEAEQRALEQATTASLGVGDTGGTAAAGAAATSAPAAAAATLSEAPAATISPAANRAQVDDVMAMGFSREQAIQALEATGGSVEMAVSMLLD